MVVILGRKTVSSYTPASEFEQELAKLLVDVETTIASRFEVYNEAPSIEGRK